MAGPQQPGFGALDAGGEGGVVDRDGHFIFGQIAHAVTRGADQMVMAVGADVPMDLALGAA